MVQPQNESKYEYLFKLELRGKSIPYDNQGKIAVLQKRRKKVNFMMLANILFIGIFYTSYEMGWTNLNSSWLIVGIAVVFFINMLLQYNQITTIKEAIAHYSSL